MTEGIDRHFDRVADAYAAMRPRYPLALGAALAGLAPRRELALEVGCGSGQLTLALAPHFARLLAVDPASAAIARARQLPNVRYRVARAEATGAADGSIDLVVAAQAAHWFDLDAFHAECRRVARPGAAVALIGYGDVRLEDASLAPILVRFQRRIAPFWPPERRLVDGAYAELGFPYREIELDLPALERICTLPELLGYVATSSAVAAAAAAGEEAILDGLRRDLAAAWADPAIGRRVVWPVFSRIGFVDD